MKDLQQKDYLTSIVNNESTITLSNCEIDQEAIFLTLNPNLKDLHLEKCLLTEQSSLALIDLIKNSQTLKNISFDKIEIDADFSETKRLLLALGNNKTLQKLSIKNCDLEEGVWFLENGLKDNQTLQELHLHNCRIKNDKEGIALANSLVSSQSLLIFDILDKKSNYLSNDIDSECYEFSELENVMKKNKIADQEMKRESRPNLKRRSTIQPGLTPRNAEIESFKDDCLLQAQGRS